MVMLAVTRPGCADANMRCLAQLLAACERDGEAERALEAFARMEREAPSECPFLSHLTCLPSHSQLLCLALGTRTVHQGTMFCWEGPKAA